MLFIGEWAHDVEQVICPPSDFHTHTRAEKEIESQRRTGHRRGGGGVRPKKIWWWGELMKKRVQSVPFIAPKSDGGQKSKTWSKKIEQTFGK